MSSADDYHEYYHIQNIISKYNENCLEIKKWSVTTASFVAVVGEVAGTPLIVKLVTIIVLALAFWMTETVWRVNQWAFIRRVQELEAGNPDGPLLSSRWTRFYFGKTRSDRMLSATKPGWDDAQGEVALKRVIGHFLSWRAALPHALIALVATGLLTAETLGWFPPKTKEPAEHMLKGRIQVEQVPPASSSAP